MNVQEVLARFEAEASSRREVQGKKGQPPVVVRCIPPVPVRKVKENVVPSEPRLRPSASPQPSQPSRHQDAPFNPVVVRIPLSPRVPSSPHARPMSPTPVRSPSPRVHASPRRRPSLQKNPSRHSLSPIATRSPSSNSSRPLISPPSCVRDSEREASRPASHSSVESVARSYFKDFRDKAPPPVRPPVPPPRPEIKVTHDASIQAKELHKPEKQEVHKPQMASPPKRASPELKQVMSPKRSKAEPLPSRQVGFDHQAQISAAKPKLDPLAGRGGVFSPPVNKSAGQLYNEMKVGVVAKLEREKMARLALVDVLTEQAEERKAVEMTNLFLTHAPLENVLTIIPSGSTIFTRVVMTDVF